MRKLTLALLLAALILAFAVVPAFAHVHGITPLASCGMANGNAGGNGTNDTPAAAGNGGPITGLIPRDTGNGSITGGEGGSGATGDNCPD